VSRNSVNIVEINASPLELPTIATQSDIPKVKEHSRALSKMCSNFQSPVSSKRDTINPVSVGIPQRSQNPKCTILDIVAIESIPTSIEIEHDKPS
jgi:hypothetical protein